MTMRTLSKIQTKKILNLLQEKQELQEQLTKINSLASFVFSSEKESNFRVYIPGKEHEEIEKYGMSGLSEMFERLHYPLGRPVGLERKPSGNNNKKKSNDLDISVSDRECLAILGVLIGSRELRLREIDKELEKFGIKIKQ